jgi:hypothetical protein
MPNLRIAQRWLLAHAKEHHLTNLEPWVNGQRLQLTGIFQL